MYKYPTVPRLDPEEIPRPKCMYSVQPIFKSNVVSNDTKSVFNDTKNVSNDTKNVFNDTKNSHCGDDDNDDSDLQPILEKQESVLKKLTELESRLSSSGLSEVDLMEVKIRSLAVRQEKLLESINSLEQRLKNAAINDVLNAASTSSVGDISIFVNWSCLPSKLKNYIKFFKTQGLRILTQIHCHSSVSHLKLENVWNDIHDRESSLNRLDFDGTITFIVREQATLEPILVLHPQNPAAKIEGDDNIIKFLDQRFGHLLRNKH